MFEVRGATGKTNGAKSDEPSKETTGLGFAERNRTFFDTYIGDGSVVFKSAEGVETPDGPLDTCAVDLAKDPPEVYLHDRFLTDEYGGSEAKMLFGICHELEHIRELRELIRESGGVQVWEALLRKKEAKKRYHILDNSFGDVKMNRGVVERAPALGETRQSLYRDDLFAERDLTTLPKHLQFAHVLNCEQQDTGEAWTVAPDVREAFERLKAMKGKSGVPFLGYASHPATPMSVRLRLQDAVIEPIYEKFFEEDVERKRQEKKNGEQKRNDQGQGAGNARPEAGENGKAGEGKLENGPQTGEAGDEPKNPEEYFKEVYEDILKKYRRAIPDGVVNNAVRKEIERQAAEAKGEDTGKRASEAYAAAQGVTPKDLRVYRRFPETVEQINNPETNERVIEELRALFAQIITRRKKRLLAPKYPLPEGDLLAYPTEAVVRTRAGEVEPDVWEDVEFRERDAKLAGDFDVTVVGDVSVSMKGEKADAQRLAMALALEALAEFSDELEDRRVDLAHDLHVRTEGWVFGDRAECVKALSEELSERERVAIHKRLGKPDGQSTQDFLVLEELLKNLSDEEREKLRSGKLRKIVIVMTDGESDDAARVQAVLGALREAGVIAFGIGITKGGKSALTTYAPEAKLCERVEGLAIVLSELLKEHLKSL